VCCSDATLIFGLSEVSEDGDDPATRWTQEFAHLVKRPLHSCDPRKATASEIIEWLAEAGKERPVKWLNIAGPSKNRLKQKVGRHERDHFLDATRALIACVIREFGPTAAC
jgi:hypothetical protein